MNSVANTDISTTDSDETMRSGLQMIEAMATAAARFDREQSARYELSEGVEYMPRTRRGMLAMIHAASGALMATS